MLVSNGFFINDIEKYIYSKIGKKTYVIICLYVDNMLIFRTSLKVICETKRFQEPKFNMKDLGETKIAEGMKIIRTFIRIKLS